MANVRVWPACECAYAPAPRVCYGTSLTGTTRPGPFEIHLEPREELLILYADFGGPFEPKPHLNSVHRRLRRRGAVLSRGTTVTQARP